MARLTLLPLMIALISLMLLLCACSQETQRLDANRRGRELDSLIQALNHQRDLDSQNSASYLELGRAYHEKAEYEIKKTWARTDSRLTSAKDKIRTLFALSRTNYEHALRLDSTSAKCCIALGLSYELEWMWLDNEYEQEWDWESFELDGATNWLVRWYFSDHRRYPEGIAKARHFFRRTIELEPENSDAWYHLGLVTGKEDEAIQCLRRALSIDQNYAKAYLVRLSFRDPAGTPEGINDPTFREEYLAMYVRAKALLQREPERFLLYPYMAEEAYNARIRRVPSVAKLFYWLGVLSLQKSNVIFDRGQFYELMSEKQPYNTQILHMLCWYKNWLAAYNKNPFKQSSRTSAAVASYDQLLRLSEYTIRLGWCPYTALKQPLTDSYWLRLNAALQMGRDEAVPLLRTAIASDSVRAIGHYVLGFTLFSTGDLGNAEKSLLTADRAWPEDRYARLRANQLLTLLYLKQGNFNSAMKSFEVANALDSVDTRSMLKRALYSRRGAIDASADSILTLKHQNGQRERKFIAAMCLANGWARYYANFGKNQAEALSWAEKAIQFDPQNATAHLDYADFCMFTDRRAERASALRRALNCDPSNLQTYLVLALELSPTYSSEQSIELVRKAAEMGSYSAKDILQTTGQKEQKK